MRFLFLFFLFLNSIFASDFNQLMQRPYDIKLANEIIDTYSLSKNNLSIIYHVAALTESQSVKNKILKMFKANNLLKDLLHHNDYEKLLILENLNLLSSEDLDKYLQDIHQQKSFYQEFYELKHKTLISSINVDNFNDKQPDVWFRNNGNISALIELYSLNSDTSHNIFNKVSSNI